MKPIAIAFCASAILSIACAPTSAANIRRELTPEERLIYMQQVRGSDWASMNLQQRCTRRQEMRREFASMSPSALQSLKQKLDARWNAMPAAERQRIEQRIADRRANPAERSATARRSPCSTSPAP